MFGACDDTSLSPIRMSLLPKIDDMLFTPSTQPPTACSALSNLKN
jgi:hypothetical protein